MSTSVVPARAGVFPCGTCSTNSTTRSSPRERGCSRPGGVRARQHRVVPARVGCSGPGGGPAPRAGVVPARAGVFRSCWPATRQAGGRPQARSARSAASRPRGSGVSRRYRQWWRASQRHPRTSGCFPASQNDADVVLLRPRTQRFCLVRQWPRPNRHHTAFTMTACPLAERVEAGRIGPGSTL